MGRTHAVHRGGSAGPAGGQRTSPDFRPAYDPLRRIASSLARSHPHAARSVLTDLAQIQPARPEAGLALRQLGIAMR